ncbi:MAG: hypothetical protein LQ343_007457 [Gyalolechia ehrenbergii]|nr:MAG: hypothetical protein LQ343_007457 [Gyalolechia ehrenbergii]
MSLHRIGQDAARMAAVKAYWVDFECLGPEVEREQNAWRISDVVLAAYQLVIAIAGPVDAPDVELPYNLLRAWGNRLDKCLRSPPKQITLRSFLRYWEDHELMGQLIDHYENPVILTPFELITIALKCLEVRYTTQHLHGDLSYSLMGLLRRRPNAQKNESGFLVFTRLSFANNSNMLLERLIRLLPQSPYKRWDTFHDHCDASLWDICPRTQVCGIGHNDTVILDGARAATIRWKSFKGVLLHGNDTFKRKLARVALAFCSVFFIFGVSMLASAAGGASPSGSSELIAIGAIFMAFSASILLASLILIKWLYLGKVLSAQPWFFGIEGYTSLPAIEKNLFGGDLGRLN